MRLLPLMAGDVHDATGRPAAQRSQRRSECNTPLSFASPPRKVRSQRSRWRSLSYYPLVLCSPSCLDNEVYEPCLLGLLGNPGHKTAASGVAIGRAAPPPGSKYRRECRFHVGPRSPTKRGGLRTPDGYVVGRRAALACGCLAPSTGGGRDHRGRWSRLAATRPAAGRLAESPIAPSSCGVALRCAILERAQAASNSSRTGATTP